MMDGKPVCYLAAWIKCCTVATALLINYKLATAVAFAHTALSS